ncbi:MAG: hypothetical protein GX751_10525 [Desulfuromonadaceae bacterium]|nr:hypothetical protein [Desulfuromonadaceae bacterium]
MKIISAFVLLLFWIAPGFADQTIYCPQAKDEIEKQCKVANEKFRQIDETIARWSSHLDDPNMILYRINRFPNESKANYLERVKSMQSFYYKGLNYPVRGRFTTQEYTYIPLTKEEARNVLGLAFQSRQKVDRQMRYVQENTKTLKTQIRNKISRLNQEHQHYTLFRAQCCGYRWTNDVGYEPKPVPPHSEPNLNEVELLNVPQDK